MAFAEKVRGDRVVVIDELSFEAPKTRIAASILDKLNLSRTVLVVVDAYDASTYDKDKNVYLSFRNLPTAKILPENDLNAYEVLRPYQLLVTKTALDAFVKTRVEK